MSGSGSATLAESRQDTGKAEGAPRGGGGARSLATAGVVVYGLGMLSAMIGTAILTGDWLLTLLILPQALCAVGFGAGAMGGALLAPDPYVKEH